MNSTSWYGLVIILALGAVLSVSAMKRLGAPLPKYEQKEALKTVAKADGKNVKLPEPKKTMAPGSNRISSRQYDVLWQKSLFQDDRTEEEEDGGKSQEAAQPVVNSDFELIGLARIGRKDAAVPIAIIMQIKSNVRQNRQIGSRVPPRRPGGPVVPSNRTVNQPEPDPEDRRVDRNIYRVGDTIGKTGYMVKSITIEENKVIIARGSQEQVLVLDEKNTTNSVRRENAKREEMAVRAKFQEKAKAAVQPEQNAQAGQNPQAGLNPQAGQPPQNAGRIVQPVVPGASRNMPPRPPSLPGMPQNNSIQPRQDGPGAGTAPRGMSAPHGGGSQGMPSRRTFRRHSPIPARPQE